MKTLIHRSRIVGLFLATAGLTTAGAEPSPSASVSPLSVTEVELLEGPFQNAMRQDAIWLRSLDCDRLLSWFRKEAGLEPKAEVYGGWESRGIAGHSLGHYLTACALMHHASGDEEFRRRVDYIVDQLVECQQAGNDGYVGAIPDGRKVFAEVSRGDIRSAGFDLNGVWVPWYTMHKIFAGLIDAYVYCENEKALEVATKLADWACEITASLTPEQWERMLDCEHGGMNESLARLYEITGKEAHLQLAQKFFHHAILDPLAEGRDELNGKHSNTQIPKVVGVARIADVTDDEKLAQLASFFWETMVRDHSYVTGGNSIGEHLGPPGKLNDRLGPTTTETCNTYNMLRLTAELFARKPEARYADYAERALWNHILASQDPGTGRVCYFVPLQSGAEKPFMDPETFTCCSGTGMENHARYGEYIYAKRENELYVNQFISSKADWSERQVSVTQRSGLPAEGSVELEVRCDGPRRFKMLVRRPSWAGDGYRLTVNGAPMSVDAPPGEYVEIGRVWEDRDTVQIVMPMELRHESMPDNPNRVAVFYGPILLSGELQESIETAPVLVTNDRPVQDWVAESDDEALRFTTQGVGRPSDITLTPFHSHAHGKYAVYWDLFTDAQWRERQEAYQREQQRLRELEARTVDLFNIGEMQPERDHDLKGENTSAEEYRGRKLRHAWDGGWFSFRIDLPEEGPADLLVTYWGSELGARTFDVLLDDNKLATQSLHQDDPEKFWERVYELPESHTRGKSNATIKFQAHPGNYAGGVFGVRVVKREPAPDDSTEEDESGRGARADKPLFRDPVFDGAADPVVVWNRAENAWWMFYTNRRANLSEHEIEGVNWVHGTHLGIARSTSGAEWEYVGTAELENAEKGPTLWAPDVLRGEDEYHMYVTIVPGVFSDWGHPRRIAHYTSDDLRHWRYRSTLDLATEKVIDASVLRVQDGWRMWYNNETDKKSIYYADSEDLYHWVDRGKVPLPGQNRGEGPKVFRFQDAYWMVMDVWDGLAVFRSDDALTWERQQENLLRSPGSGADDTAAGQHADVLVSQDRAYLFYFTHPGRGADGSRRGYESRRSSIQVTELFADKGELRCDRNAPTWVNLAPPK